MNITFIGQKGVPSRSGGIEKHVEDLATELVARGHDVRVYTRPNYTDPALKEYKGISLVSLPSIATKNLDAISHTFLAVLDLLRRKTDIIHFHGIGPSSLIPLARILKPRAKIVATFHCQDYFLKKWSRFARFYLRFGEWVACTMADATIAVSRSLSAYVAETYSRPALYIPSGVHAPATGAEAALGDWGLEPKEYILAVSRLIPDKGLHFLVDAFKRTKTEKKLVIAGDGAYTDAYVSELQMLAASDPRIIFVGRQHGEALNALYTHAALFVQPSQSEGLSIALLEAMSYGLPVLVSDIAGNLEAIGTTGLTFTNRSVSDLEEKLAEFLAADPKDISMIASAGRERVMKEYGWQAIASSTETLYSELIEKRFNARINRLAIARRFATFL